MSGYTNDCLCGNICEHVHLCKMVLMVLTFTHLWEGQGNALSSLSVWYYGKAVTLHSCVMVSSLRPSALFLMSRCPTSTSLNGAVAQHYTWTPFCPEESRPCYHLHLFWSQEAKVRVCTNLYFCACLCLRVCVRERWWWWWAHPFSLDYSRDFLYDVVKWLWTSTFQSWNLHGDQWALLVSPLGFLFSFHQMAASFFSFLPADFQTAGLMARNSWKLTWVFLNEPKKLTYWLSSPLSYIFFAVFWGLEVSWLPDAGYFS